MKTKKVEIVVGLYAGYNHENLIPDGSKVSMVEFASVVMTLANEVESSTGVYPSMIAAPAATIYKTDWGCPVGGEETVVLSGICNPSFRGDKTPQEFESAWCETMLMMAQLLKAAFVQSTATVQFSEVELVYLT